MTAAPIFRPDSYIAALSWLIDRLLPRHCIACGAASGESNLCSPCRQELPRIVHGCKKCGMALSLESDSICGLCLSRAPPWQNGTAALDYQFPVDQLVCRFKFQRDLACGEVLAQELLRTINRVGPPLPNVIIPVPLHHRRQFSRSFNQAEVLARPVARRLNIPVACGVLKRVRSTRAQSGLTATDRRKNIRGAFRCRQRVPPHVALVDDVLTTGTTLAECSRALLRAGANEVSVWVAARANIN
jgi:ComF family protein